MNKNNLFTWLACAAAASLTALPALATDSAVAAGKTPQASDAAVSGAIAFLRAHDASVVALLEGSGDSLSTAAQSEVRAKIDEAFDYEELSRLSLRGHWEELSASERAEFVSVFSAIISLKNFDSFVDYYRDSNIVYVSEQIEEPRASVYATVPLERGTVGITYRLLRHDSSWRVYDLVIDDVSTADSNRRQYSRQIKKHSFEELLKKLHRQLEKLKSR
jgi:phospholipid transport system substrate-binding protein